jgi:hypothetical protein
MTWCCENYFEAMVFCNMMMCSLYVNNNVFEEPGDTTFSLLLVRGQQLFFCNILTFLLDCKILHLRIQ